MAKIDTRKAYWVEIVMPTATFGITHNVKLTVFAHSKAVILNMFREYTVRRIDVSPFH